MRVLISPHAAEQIRFRELSPEFVIHVATNPEQMLAARFDRYFAQSKFTRGGKEYLLRVLVEIENDELRILTVYPTSKVAKYWQGEDK